MPTIFNLLTLSFNMTSLAVPVNRVPAASCRPISTRRPRAKWPAGRGPNPAWRRRSPKPANGPYHGNTPFAPLPTPKSSGPRPRRPTRTKKADVGEHPEALPHVGLLITEPSHTRRGCSLPSRPTISLNGVRSVSPDPFPTPALYAAELERQEGLFHFFHTAYKGRSDPPHSEEKAPR